MFINYQFRLFAKMNMLLILDLFITIYNVHILQTSVFSCENVSKNRSSMVSAIAKPKCLSFFINRSTTQKFPLIYACIALRLGAYQSPVLNYQRLNCLLISLTISVLIVLHFYVVSRSTCKQEILEYSVLSNYQMTCS